MEKVKLNIKAPITFIVKNNTSEKRKAVLMGYNKNLVQPNFGSDNGVSVKVEDEHLTHADVMEHIDLLSTKIIERTNNPKQLSNIISFYGENDKGENITIPIVRVGGDWSEEELEKSGTKFASQNQRLKFGRHSMLIVQVNPDTELKITIE